MEAVVKKVPSALADHLVVLTGDEIFKRVLEREVRSHVTTETQQQVSESRTQVYRPDPALLLFGVVLTSWDESER